MTSRVVKGHAFRGVESNVYNDRRYICECGETGGPVRSVYEAREDHRGHKLAVTFDVMSHGHNITTKEMDDGYFHSHPWGSEVHNHMLRAVCGRAECKGFATHNIHEGPEGGRESDRSESDR